MILTIKRSKWLTGSREVNNSKLLRSTDGKMCCLGFLAKKCGASEDDIQDISTPDDVPNLPNLKWPKGILDEKDWNTDLCHEMMTANDSHNLPRSKRETKLRDLFKKIGITLRFVD